MLDQNEYPYVSKVIILEEVEGDYGEFYFWFSPKNRYSKPLKNTRVKAHNKT